MTTNVTRRMRALSRWARMRELPPRETRPRDRSLRGKARRRSRKAAA